MGVGLINYLSGKSYLNALFLLCNGPCLLCSHVGGVLFLTHPHDVVPKDGLLSTKMSPTVAVCEIVTPCGSLSYKFPYLLPLITFFLRVSFYLFLILV